MGPLVSILARLATSVGGRIGAGKAAKGVAQKGSEVAAGKGLETAARRRAADQPPEVGPAAGLPKRIPGGTVIEGEAETPVTAREITRMLAGFQQTPSTPPVGTPAARAKPAAEVAKGWSEKVPGPPPAIVEKHAQTVIKERMVEKAAAQLPRAERIIEKLSPQPPGAQPPGEKPTLPRAKELAPSIPGEKPSPSVKMPGQPPAALPSQAKMPRQAPMAFLPRAKPAPEPPSSPRAKSAPEPPSSPRPSTPPAGQRSTPAAPMFVGETAKSLKSRGYADDAAQRLAKWSQARASQEAKEARAKQLRTPIDTSGMSLQERYRRLKESSQLLKPEVVSEQLGGVQAPNLAQIIRVSERNEQKNRKEEADRLKKSDGGGLGSLFGKLGGKAGAIGLVIGGLFAFKHAIDKAGQAVEEQSRSLSIYNAELATTFAKLDFGKILLDVKKAGETAESAAWAAEQKLKSMEAGLRYAIAFSNIVNRATGVKDIAMTKIKEKGPELAGVIATTLLASAGTTALILGVLRELLQEQKKKEPTKKEMEEAMPYQQFLIDIAAGNWGKDGPVRPAHGRGFAGRGDGRQ